MMDRRAFIVGSIGIPSISAAASSSQVGGGASSLQASIDGLGAGRTLCLAAGAYPAAGGGLLQKIEQSWLLEPGALVRGDSKMMSGANLLTVRIPDQAEFRGGALEGGGWLIQNFGSGLNRASAAAAFSSSGAVIALVADAGSANVINYRIRHSAIGGAAVAVRWSGTDAGKTVAWSGITESTLLNGVVCEHTADGMMFRDNISDGIEPAYRFNLLEGAYCCSIEGGSTANRKGALDVENGALWRVINCQMEHGVAYADSTPAESTIIVRGTRYRSYLGIIEKNNFGAGLGRVRDTIILQNATGTVIDENYFFLSDRADIRIEADSCGTSVGTRNMGRGRRPLVAPGAYTDASRRLTISLPPNQHGKRAVGTRGVWHPAGEVLTDFQMGWEPWNLEIMLTEAGLVTFNGGLRGGAAKGPICTFPQWLLPHDDAWLHVTVIADGSVRAVRLEASTGKLSVLNRLTGVELNLSNATYSAVIGFPYTEGP